MPNLEIKGRHDVLTPRHEALVFEKTVTTPEQPDLLTKSRWNSGFHG
jgi:hypothetical protein